VNDHPWWYVARATGVVAWLLLAVTVLGGFAVANRRSRSAAKTVELHRFVGALAVCFVAAHIAALIADRFVDYGIREVLLPLASIWRPGPVAWGVVAMYLLLIVEGSSLLQRRLSYRRWRRLHLLSYPLFGVATMHFITAGTDVYAWSPTWLTTALGVALVGASIVGMVLAERRMPEWSRPDTES
jgi:DMSO/TMAO reductase YedYZ heme-binding membrane subunit